jgi:hypothetical protein
LRHGGQAAAGGECHSKLVIFVLLLLDIHSLNALDKKADELCTALSDVSFDGRALSQTRELLFSNGGPELDALSTHLLVFSSGAISCNLAQLLEKELY